MKWYNASETLPKKSGWYLTATKIDNPFCQKDTYMTNVDSFSVQHQRFNCFDGNTAEHACDVNFWAKIPRLPIENFRYMGEAY